MTAPLAPLSAPTASAPSAERAQLAEAARRFEAIFVRQMLAAARKADFGGDLLGSEATDTFRQMQDEHFADVAANNGSFGLAQMIERQLATHIVPRDAADGL